MASLNIQILTKMDLFKSISLLLATLYFLSLINFYEAKDQPIQSTIDMDKTGRVRGIKAEGLFMPKNFNKADISELLKDPNVKNLPGLKSQLKKMIANSNEKSSKKRRCSKGKTKRRTLKGALKENGIRF